MLPKGKIQAMPGVPLALDRESGQAAMMFESTVMFQASSSHSGM
jgi:hypothetical protein